jgi:hypothetical protein
MPMVSIVKQPHSEVRFAPNIGHCRLHQACPRWANERHRTPERSPAKAQQKAAAGLRKSAAASHFGHDKQPATNVPMFSEEKVSHVD